MFAPDPNFVALAEPVTLRVRHGYVERGPAVLRDLITQDIEPPTGGPHTAFALCAAA